MYNVMTFENFSKERMAKLFEMAVESGMTDWCLTIRPFEEKKAGEKPFDFYRRMVKGFYLIDDDGRKYRVRPDNISKALQKMADEYEEDFSAILERKETPLICDSLLQLCVFNQVYYA